MKEVFITGISSDIGKYLSERYLNDGYKVYGTYRTDIGLEFKEKIKNSGGNCYLCDFSDKQNIKRLIEICKKDNVHWDLLICAVGNLEPIGKFIDLNFDEWEKSVYVNAISQLRFLHGIFSLKNSNSTVLFFAGGGTNNAFSNYSAYCISKILLMKMCELLDDENKEINILIAGPGIIGTKIHQQTLLNKNSAGDNYLKTVKFLETEGESYQKSLERIYEFINWAMKNGRNVCGGRNFSIVHDDWDKNFGLVDELLFDNDMYKLRRYKN